MHALRISLLSLVLLPGCALGQKDADQSTANNKTDTAVETSDSVTDSGDTANETAADPCAVTACERRLRDADDDGYGDPNNYLFVPPETAWEDGYVQWITGRDDCDDTNAAIHPDAAEACNGIDDDCDTVIDEDMPTWYADGDGDGYGDPTVSVPACEQPAGYVANATDCDDWHAEQNPGVSEYCNGADDNCDGEIPAEEIDVDGDGFNGCTAAADCDDTDATTYPGSSGTGYMQIGVDWDCDGKFWCSADLDGDGYADMNFGYSLWPYVFSTDLVCGNDPGEAELTDPVSDCNDSDAEVYPGSGC